MVLQEYDGVESVSLAAYEAQAERNVRTVKYMALGWVVTTIALCLALMVCLSYSEEVVTETTTETTEETQTLERVAQADNQGNAIVGDGDITIGDSTRNVTSDGENVSDEINND